MSFLKESLLKTPVGHNPFSKLQILISLPEDQQASPTKRKIEVPSSEWWDVSRRPSWRERSASPTQTALLELLLCHTQGKGLCCQGSVPWQCFWTAASGTHHGPCTDTWTISITSLSASSRHRWPASHSLLPASSVSINLNLAVWAMFNHKQLGTCFRI